MIYQLLEWRPLNFSTDPMSVREEILRLATLLYMAPIWRKFGQFPVRTQIIVGKLMLLLKEEKDDWGPMWPFKMWALYMAVVESEQPEAAQYFPRAFAECIYERRLASWHETMQAVKSVLWLPSAFEDSVTLVKDEMEGAVQADRLEEIDESEAEEAGETAGSSGTQNRVL